MANLRSPNLIDCAQCGRNYAPWKSRWGLSQFCSRKCASASRRIDESRPCLVCGTSFNVIRRHPGRQRHFCNRVCMGIFYRKPDKTIRKNINKLRWTMIEKENASCIECGYAKYPQILHLHHKDHDHDNNEESNLALICPNCHAIEHRVKHRSPTRKPVVDRRIV